MPVSFRCDACQKPLRVNDERAGRRIRCPACGEAVTVPTPAAAEARAAVPVQAASEAEAAPPARKPRRPRSRNDDRPFLARHWPLCLAGALLVLVLIAGGALGLGLWLGRAKGPPQTDVAAAGASDGPPRPAPKAAGPDIAAPPPQPATPPGPAPSPPPAQGPKAPPPETLEVYRFRPEHTTGTPTREVRIYEEDDGQPHTSVLGDGVIGFAQARPGVMAFGVPIPGSTGLHVVVNRKRGYTTAAGLRFQDDAVIDLPLDGAVKVDRAGVNARDAAGAAYVSREVSDGAGKRIVMVRGSGGPAAAGPGPGPAVAVKPPEIGPGPAPAPMPPPAPPPDPPAAPAAAGWWAVKATGGEARLLVEQGDHLATAVTRDLKQAAVFDAPADNPPPGKAGRAAGVRVAVGPVGKTPQTVWTAKGEVAGLAPVRAMRWSPGGQWLFITGPGGIPDPLLVVDRQGKSKLYGGAGELPAVETRAGVTGVWPLVPETAQWVGRGDNEIAVVTRGLPSLLVVLNPATGQRREVCALPIDPPFVSRTGVSDDLGAVALFDTMGIWTWRRGQKGFTKLVTDVVEAAALSPDGKYVAATLVDLNGNHRSSVLYEVAGGKEVWTAPRGSTGFAFDPAGKHLAMASDEQLTTTPLDAFDPTELVKGGGLPIDEPAWSADGQEVLFRRLPAP